MAYEFVPPPETLAQMVTGRPQAPVLRLWLAEFPRVGEVAEEQSSHGAEFRAVLSIFARAAPSMTQETVA